MHYEGCEAGTTPGARCRCRDEGWKMVYIKRGKTMSDEVQDLRQRTKAFALRIIKLFSAKVHRSTGLR